jgi:Spy/CpxP family protein refolding chaperone
MITLNKRSSTFACAVVLTATLLAAPALAQAPATPSTTQPMPAPKPAKPTAHRAYGIEARIKSLHDRLHITKAQDPAWDRVAHIMRENAETLNKMVRERNAKLRTMTAVENLQTYGEIAQAHADGVKKLASAFDSLYDSMSATQKKDADEVFRGIAARRHVVHKPAAPAPK